MGKVKIIGGKPQDVEVFINGEKVTQPIVSITWRMDCEKVMPVLTLEMYADADVEVEGEATVSLLTRED